MYSSSRSGSFPHPFQGIDILPGCIFVYPESRGFTQQIDGPEKGASAGRPHIVFKVRRGLPVNRKEEDLAIFHVSVDTGLMASVLRAHRGKERLQRLIKLVKLFRFGPDFDGEIHGMFLIER